ncbi:MAG: glycosyltransferase family 9 protein [Ferruginibacter sp.]|nr:glycosyltransferase family 9 protein [Bacteroidota bacterium]MBX2919500.1 glycosyltransferase family 9 protein [Ferruginibacter sp.]MCB0709803.1 glycosyltransferase family 9 protein [Chitinophagaceae bacterium]MCC7379335.1 glycosyltransferase family 9 protein [Chitinophagaceae bacterium]
MKLLPVKKRKIAIFFTSGIGDTVLHVPLMKALKQKQFIITCIFISRYDNDCLFDDSIADKKVYLKTKLSMLLYAITRLKHFTNVYINHLEEGRWVKLLAWLCGKVVTKSTRKKNKGKLHKRIKPCDNYFSDAEQNLYLLFSKYNATIKDIRDFYLPSPILNEEILNKFELTRDKKRFFVLQVSAGNNLTPFKNWPINYWHKVVNKLCLHYQQFEFVIIGDNTETGFVAGFENLLCNNLKILIGKTSVEDACNLIAKSHGYIGLDSGFLHIAVALQKKTLAIFGASNEKLYGYGMIDPINHKEIIAEIGCRPCHGWKCVNSSRVSNPLLCPDFACLTSIEPKLVYEEIVTHFSL